MTAPKSTTDVNQVNSDKYTHCSIKDRHTNYVIGEPTDQCNGILISFGSSYERANHTHCNEIHGHLCNF